MIRIMTLTIALLIFVLASPVAWAESGDPLKDHATVIALSMDDFELAETDVSNMEPGDVETFYSGSGKRVDLLRTEDGVEIYVDGELVDVGMHGGGEAHGGHAFVHRHVEVICEAEEECDDVSLMSGDHDVDFEALHQGHGVEKVIVIRKEVDSD